MAITKYTDGTIVVTGSHIQLAKLLAQRSALNLEAKGLRRSGRSLTATLKEYYAIKGSRQKLINHITALIEEYN